MKITVFTPTYNRGYIIEKLYRSLQTQTVRDFEWVVVDDGSTDNTEEIFQRILLEENDFSIQYIKTENGGKHRAINCGLTLAKGKMFFIVDSDDYLPTNALETIIKVEATIFEDEKERFAGVCGIKAFFEGNCVGASFEGEFLDITMLERPKYKIYGDKAEVFYTSVLKRYPFPEFEGEKFVAECVVWDKIAYDGYKLRFFNETVYYCDYLEDGLSKNYWKVYAANPRGYGLYIQQMILHGKIRGKQIKNEYKTYVRTHKKKYTLRELASWLNVKKGKIFFQYVKMEDIRHLPNRIFRKMLGGKRCERLKNKVKKENKK